MCIFYHTIQLFLSVECEARAHPLDIRIEFKMLHAFWLTGIDFQVDRFRFIQAPKMEDYKEATQRTSLRLGMEVPIFLKFTLTHVYILFCVLGILTSLHKGYFSVFYS